MYNSIVAPIRKTLHLAVDYSVPKNEFIALASGAIGYQCHLLVDTYGTHIIIDIWNRIWGIQDKSVSSLSWFDFLVTVPYATRATRETTAHYTGLGAALATSFILNLIAEVVFKIKERKPTLNARKNDLMTQTFLQRPLHLEDLRYLAFETPQKAKSPVKPEILPKILPELPKIVETIIPDPIAVQPQLVVVQPQPVSIPIPIARVVSEKIEPTWDNILEEMDNPCCGQVFASLRKVWENGKPDSVNQRLNAGEQSFI